jgi:hypothetical protein
MNTGCGYAELDVRVASLPAPQFAEPNVSFSAKSKHLSRPNPRGRNGPFVERESHARSGMTMTMLFVALLACACSSPDTTMHSAGGVLCADAGGQCVLGGTHCANEGNSVNDCNPDSNPGGGHCCLPCPSGTQVNDAGTACQ